MAVLTVIQPELQAVKRALKIQDSSTRIRIDGNIFYEASVFSAVMKRDLRIVVGCVGDATQGAAAAMTMFMLREFDFGLIILVGISAGLRGSIRIGDVIVPRTVVDVSLTVAKPGSVETRPVSSARHNSVKQMLAGFEINTAAFHAHSNEVFGHQLSIPAGEESVYAKEVTLAPVVSDGSITTADILLKDPSKFANLASESEGVRGHEMEAGGFIKACKMGEQEKPWLVVRGISDFGDTFKNDEFHRLAASAAAAWTVSFIRSGVDLPQVKQTDAVPQIAVPAEIRASDQSPGTIGGLAAILITDQLEKLQRIVTQDRRKEFEDLREQWRAGKGAATLAQVRAMQSADDWKLLDFSVRGAILRFEASLLLATSNDFASAASVVVTAKTVDPTANYENIDTLIVYHRDGAVDALSVLSNPTVIESWNLKMALLGECGRWPDVLDQFEKPPQLAEPNAESIRLKAMALAFSKRLSEARSEVERALAMAPSWFAVRYASGVIDYFECLSPAAQPMGWPMPVDKTLIRRDSAAVNALRRAAALFSDLLKAETLSDSLRETIEGWRIACLANDAEGESKAAELCAEIVKRNPRQPIALAWAAARGFNVSVAAGIDALYKELFNV